ncbi:MAG TPA: LD-carboxypeptidase [Candidatus Kapabacteria bacterium]|nr:LD-carboxypeptidase [Candidatus Kapabacteria bacterium]
MDESKRELLRNIGIVSTSLMLGNKLIANDYIEDDGRLINYRDTTSTLNGNSLVIKDIVNLRPLKITPKGLIKGSKIAFTSPASSTSMGEIASTVNFYKKMGCEVVIGDTIKLQKNNYRYFSAPDKQRAEEFMKYIEDKTISAIVCGRGGYGSGRILQHLNFDIIKNNPKIIIGFSDITILLLAISKLTGLVTYHGPVASVKLNNFTISNLLNSIFYKEKFDDIKLSDIKIMNDGIVEGEIIGGNLTMIISSMGTPYEIDTKNKILFIEDVSVNAYEIDRMLTQLYNANKLQESHAIVFNGFKNINTRRPFYPNKGYSIKEVIEQIVKPLGKPLIYDFEFGHESNMVTLPIGINIRLDLNKKLLSFLERPTT